MDEAARAIPPEIEIFDMVGVTDQGELLRGAFGAHVLDGEFMPVPVAGAGGSGR